jgi:hypothetical protein
MPFLVPPLPHALLSFLCCLLIFSHSFRLKFKKSDFNSPGIGTPRSKFVLQFGEGAEVMYSFLFRSAEQIPLSLITWLPDHLIA